MRSQITILFVIIVYSIVALIPAGYSYACGTTQLNSDGDLLLDPRCHTQQQCRDNREQRGASGDAITEGFVTSDAISETCAALAAETNDPVGYCLAGSEATTNISFFGKNDFRGIGDFISYIYTISTGIAATLAVIMIIAAGIQIMTAGGNASTVGTAKKRIGAAIGGLVLLSAAYVILRTINPALVELKQPSAFIINPQAIEPIEAAEEQLCDPDGTGPFGSCPQGQYCMNMPGMSLEESLDGPCDIAAVAIVTAPAVVAGLIGAAPTFSTLLQATVNAGRSRVINYFATIGGQRTLIAKLATFGGSAIRTTVQGARFAGGAVVLYGVNEITGATDAVTNAISRFTSARGICQPVSNGLQAGDICSTDPNAGVRCGNGLNCVADPSLQNSLGCWGPSAMGFCSSGENGAICNTDEDCDEDFWCLEKDWGGTLGRRKSCTDGTEGAYCDPRLTNAAGVQCANGLSCIDGVCTAFAATEEFDICNSHANCANVPRGRTFCLGIDTSCRYRTLDNELDDGTLGVCIEPGRGRTGADFSARFWSLSSTKYYTALDGTRYTQGPADTASLFYKIAAELGSSGHPLTFDIAACGGESNRFTDSNNALYRNELRRAGHSIIYNGRTLGPVTN